MASYSKDLVLASTNFLADGSTWWVAFPVAIWTSSLLHLVALASPLSWEPVHSAGRQGEAEGGQRIPGSFSGPDLEVELR